MNSQSHVVARPPNWLPLPQASFVKKVTEEAPVEVNDLFPKGEVVTFYPHQGYGYIKDRQGQEILFRLEELELIGPKGDKKHITVGARVGYDVSCTSSGPHVRVLKVY